MIARGHGCGEWRDARALVLVLVLMATSAGAAPKDSGLALPEWDEDKSGQRHESAFPLGHGLWPSQDDERRNRVDPRLLLPPVLPDSLSGRERDAGAPIHSSSGFAGEGEDRAPPDEQLVLAWEDYFEIIPREFVIDPQFVLEPTRRSALEVFLSGHAQAGGVPVFVLIFDRGQRLPESLRLPDLARRWFGDASVVLAAFFIGEPHRLTLAFGGELGQFADSRREWVRQTCIEEARAGVSPFGQLQRSCRELSVRLYWIRRDLTTWKLDRSVRGGAERAMAPPALRVPASALTGSGGGEALRGLEDRNADGRPVTWAPWALLIGGLTIGLALAGTTAFRKLARPRPRLFPDLEASPRLGGPHCGSFSAVVRFSPNRRGRRGRRGDWGSY